MTPLEQQVREALAPNDVIGTVIGEFSRDHARSRVLSALRPLLEQQAAAVAKETPECACGWKGDAATPESAAKQFQAHLASLHQTNTRLNRRVTQAEAANSVTVDDCRRQGVPFGRSLANAECNRLTAENERLQKRLVSALYDIVIYERNNAELTAAVATLTAERDEAREIAKRRDVVFPFNEQDEADAKKIATWSGETR